MDFFYINTINSKNSKRKIIITRDRIKKLSHLSSNDSEVIAELLRDFKYNPSKTEQTLNKYNSLPEAERLIKTLN